MAGPDAARLYPGWSCPGRFDVSGGWYDAGDHGWPWPMRSAETPPTSTARHAASTTSGATRYGTDFTRRQRARHFAQALDPSFPPPPPGAIAGGPTSKEHPGFPSDPRLAGLPPLRCYLDEPTSETTNDICIGWNAPLVRMAVVLSP